MHYFGGNEFPESSPLGLSDKHWTVTFSSFTWRITSCPGGEVNPSTLSYVVQKRSQKQFWKKEKCWQTRITSNLDKFFLVIFLLQWTLSFYPSMKCLILFFQLAAQALQYSGIHLGLVDTGQLRDLMAQQGSISYKGLFIYYEGVDDL